MLRHILSHDPIAPVLWEPYYDALDRRLERLLQEIELCFGKHKRSDVLVPDELPLLKEQNPLLLYINALLHTFQTSFAKNRPYGVCFLSVCF